MKIQCNVCEVAEAKVLCCADEAALCLSCDEKVHAVNKLASMHQRVSLSASSAPMPKCDICQETVGYFFCLEDRALLCRKCDIAIHKANAYVSAHQRFLLTGVKVGLEPTDSSASPSSGKSQSIQKVKEKSQSIQEVKDPKPPSLSKRTAPVSVDAQYNKVLPAQKSGVGDCGPLSLMAGGPGAGSTPHWQVDEFLGLNDFNLDHGCMDDGSSKVDNGKLGELDCSPFFRAVEGVDIEECFSQVPETSWAVPQITSPPTASGLYWPNNYQSPFDSAMFASDISYSPLQNFQVQQSNGTGFVKKRRQC